MGLVIVGAAAVLLMSLLLPWVAAAEEFSRGAPTTLRGLGVTTGSLVALGALLMGAYGAQGLFRSRPRFHALALVVLLLLVGSTLFFRAVMAPEDLSRLGVLDDGSTELFGGLLQISTGETVPTDPWEVARRVDSRIGHVVGLLAVAAMALPMASLWGDDWERRRAAGLMP